MHLPLTLIAHRCAPSGKSLESQSVTVSNFRIAGTVGPVAHVSFGSLRGGYECTLDGAFRAPLDCVSGTSWHLDTAQLPQLAAAFDHWNETVRKKKRRPTAR